MHALLALFVRHARPIPEIVAVKGPIEPIPYRQASPTPRPLPLRTPRVSAPHVASALHARTPAQRAAPSSAPTAPPSPSRPSARKACTIPNAPAAVVAAASPPAIPAAVRAEDVSGTTVVLVQLDASGAVTGASIEQSAQSPSFDALAIAMARDTQYAPARRQCVAIASNYQFRVQWAAW